MIEPATKLRGVFVSKGGRIHIDSPSQCAATERKCLKATLDEDGASTGAVAMAVGEVYSKEGDCIKITSNNRCAIDRFTPACTGTGAGTSDN